MPNLGLTSAIFPLQSARLAVKRCAACAVLLCALIRLVTFKHKVVGSSSTRPTSENSRKPASQRAFLFPKHDRVPNCHLLIYFSSLWPLVQARHQAEPVMLLLQFLRAPHRIESLCNRYLCMPKDLRHRPNVPPFKMNSRFRKEPARPTKHMYLGD